jgi:beta-lactamase regulating signal transducer with metallopeptidase domain
MTLYVAALLLWSALHLLWQGAVVASLFAWWERAAHPAPRVRYRAATASLLALAAALVVNAVATHIALLGNARLGGNGALAGQAAFDRPFESMTLLMSLWAIGIVTQAVRLAVGAWQLRRMRRRAVDAPANLVERVESLARTMAIPVPQLRISDSRIGPFVMKGVLMLPSDWELGEELDALVLHELAHLWRGDVESNRVLRVIQVVLWFHPAVWSLVRAAVNAREEACDVESVSRSRNALVLARALVKLEERRQTLGATDGALSMRVRRLISGAQTNTRPSRAFLIVPIVVFAAGGVLAARLAPRSERLALVGAMAGAVPVQRMVIDASDPAGRFTLTLLNGRVAEATIAGVSVERGAIQRREQTLVLADARGAPMVVMELDPRGSIRWMPRSPLRP